MDINHNLVGGCPLCEIFLNPSGNTETKIYYKDSDRIKTCDFIILDYGKDNLPTVVVRDHITSISKDIWGRSIYQCRKLFNKQNIRLRRSIKSVPDHWHCKVIL